MKDIANLPFKDVWNTEEFKAAMIIKYSSGKTSSTNKALDNLENFCRAAPDQAEKIDVLSSIRNGIQEVWERRGPTQNPNDLNLDMDNDDDGDTVDLADDNGPPTASGVSARNQKPRIVTADLNQNNIIDLRDKKE